MTDRTAVRTGDVFRLVGACAGLLALSVVLGTSVNLLRPKTSRLPWVGDWEHHIETQAFRAGIPVVFLTGAQTRLADGATVLFDARIPEQYEAGHLPNARLLPVGEMDWRLGDYAALLTLKTPILVYCGGADCADALELAVKLRSIGFLDLTLYPGGYAEWIEYGGAVRTGGAP